MITSFATSSFSFCCYRNVTGHYDEPHYKDLRKSLVFRCSVTSPKLGAHQQNVTSDHLELLQNPQINDDLLSSSMKHAQKHRDVVGNQLQMAAEKEDSLMGLWLVDAIQRLGIDHHFQEEIHQVLLRRHCRAGDHDHGSLHAVSLSFRLLRQEGYYVSPDVFSKFMDEPFSMENDIKGLMELHEACQLSIEGEEILEEAAKFSTKRLGEWTRILDDKQGGMIKRALKHPYRKSLARFRAMNFKSNEFLAINGIGESLQELSSIENYMALDIRKQELLLVSKWLEDVGIAKEGKQARDQPLKWYPWPLPFTNDLSMSNERVVITKIITLIYLIDDMFDIYGEPHDLNLFTQAIKRWELDEQLPEYMKKCCREVYDVTNELALQTQLKHGFNPINSLKKAWSDLCDAFVVESRWLASPAGSEGLPKADEYLQNAQITSGVHVVLAHAFHLLGFGANNSTITLDDTLGVTSSVATIFRLWDDLGKLTDAGQSCQDGSYIDYYVKEHEGVIVQLAVNHVFNMISGEWKRLNSEFLRLNRSSSSFQKASLNLLRMIPMMNDHNDI